ncbi:MAG: MFS transporter [Neisseriaceae bacterium]
MNKQILKISLLCGVGGLLEFYDFILYIIFSDQISKNFFSEINSPSIKGIVVIAVFSIAYIIRPISGIIIGWFGDTRGRKTSFTMTILIMGASVFLMGVMPNYAQIGIAAPLVFVLLRIIQGFALGGELPSAIVFVFESLEEKGLALGIVFGLVLSGFVFGNAMSIILRDIFGQYAWRAAFISGSLIGFIAYYIRSNLTETTLFKKLSHKEKFPPAIVFNEYFRNTIGAILCVIPVSFYGVMVSLYIPKYLINNLHQPIEYVNLLMLYISLFVACCTIFISWLSDYINYNKIFNYASAIMVILAYPAFHLINGHSQAHLLLGIILLTVTTLPATSLFMRIICEAFPTKIRLTGVAIGYNFAFALVGGITPLATEVLIAKFNLILGPTIITVVCGLCGFCAIPLLSKK